MDLAAPESRMEQAMIEPKMMVIPMLPRVEPKPLAMVVMVVSGLLPRMEPHSMPPTNREMTGWTFSLTMRNTSTAMEMMIAKTNCVMIVVPPKLLTWPLEMPAAVRHGRSDSRPGNGVEIPRHSGLMDGVPHSTSYVRRRIKIPCCHGIIFPYYRADLLHFPPFSHILSSLWCKPIGWYSCRNRHLPVLILPQYMNFSRTVWL